ncbi:hypothetical protein FOA52_007275 [Chlamydomonas sp. UWO 241]|nr:hypothetical protein FOA52_007275 [Chlamydomonas sp. UWO 241]
MTGVTLKTRKRNIVIPVDPASFANAVIAICQDAAEAAGATTLKEKLDAGCKALEADSHLEFSRYNDTLFEVFFVGGMIAAGGKLSEETTSPLEENIMAQEATQAAILPFVNIFVSMTRRRPFLIRGLENTIVKLLLTTEFFEEGMRQKLAIAMALVFAQKLPVVADNIFTKTFNDRLVTKGTMLDVMTCFFKEFLISNDIEDLVSILTRGKIVNRLLDYLPPLTRSYAEFNRHFTEAGLPKLVLWHNKEIVAIKINDLMQELQENVQMDPPISSSDAISMVKQRTEEGSLPADEVIRVIWLAMVQSINMTGKNQQQLLQAVISLIKKYHKLLAANASNTKLQVALLVTVQV